jgi:hypothetical protein
MNHNKSFLPIQFLMLGLIICFFSAGVANAAPLYKGRFRLPNEVRWGHAVLPAGDYQLNFEDIGTRAFVLIRQTKSGKQVTFAATLANRGGKSTSALLIAGEGNQWVVRSLSLAEFGEVFVYEPSPMAATRDVQKSQAMQSLSVQARSNRN